MMSAILRRSCGVRPSELDQYIILDCFTGDPTVQYPPVNSKNKVWVKAYTPMGLAVWVVGMLALVCLMSDPKPFPLHDALEVAG